MSCAFPTLFSTGAAYFLAPRPVGVTIGNYLKHLMMYEDLIDTLGFATLPSTLRCAGGLCRLDVSMFVSTIMKLSCQLKSLEQSLVMKGSHSPTTSCMLPVYVEQGSTGSSSKVDSLRWWILSVCLQSSSPTVQQTYSGQHLPTSST